MARVMLEAGFAGLYPVAYDINANRDVVGAAAGHLVSLRDVDSLITLLQELAGDRRRLASMAQQYRARVERQFSIEAYEIRYNEVLHRCLPRTGPPVAQREWRG